MAHKPPFGSIRFFTKSLDDMYRIFNVGRRDENSVMPEPVKNGDEYETLFTIDRIDPRIFTWNISKSMKTLLEKAGVKAEYIVVYEAENPSENYVLNNAFYQQYRLPKSDSVNGIYEVEILDEDDGAVALKFVDADGSSNAGMVAAYYHDKKIYEGAVYLDVDTFGEEIYENLDCGAYTLKIENILIAESISEFHDMTDEEITAYCVERFKSDRYCWECFADFCENIYSAEIPVKNINPEEIKFKINPYIGKQSVFKMEANNLIDENSDDGY